MKCGRSGGIVVIGELKKGSLLGLTFELIGAGKKLAEQLNTFVSVILAGEDIEQEAEKLRHYGIDEILCITDERLKENNHSMYQKTIGHCLREKKPQGVLIGGTAFGRVLAGSIAFELDTELVVDAANIFYDAQTEEIVVSRPAFDGKNMADFSIDPLFPSVITVRSGVMGKAQYEEEERGEMLFLSPEWIEENERDLIYKETLPKKGKEIHLDQAKIIVAGGRGMKGTEGFALLERLAEKIGGEVGSSRPCVDAGWTVPMQQIGQSGISVKPKLYLAFGISGAIQHMTGIEAECILAVNQNPRAAIFQYCDYGIVGNAQKILEDLIGRNVI